MENDKFQMLTTILESMKYEDMNHSNLGHAINNVIDRFGNSLDEKQKKEVLHEFIRYEKNKKERSNMKRKVDENEEQRAMLQRFISSEQFEF